MSPLLLVSPSPARADIFQWEYINPADPSQGKRQSTTLAPDGAGVDAATGANLAGRNLTKAYLIGANLTNANLAARIESQGRGYTESPFGDGHWFNEINFRGTRLTGADFTAADVRGASSDASVHGSSTCLNSRPFAR